MVEKPGVPRVPAQSSAPATRISDKGFLPFSLIDYLQLVDWTGRQIVCGSGGRIPDALPPLLARVGIDMDDWFLLATQFGRLFHRDAGAPQTLVHPNLVQRARRGEPPVRPRFRRGQAELLDDRR